jgi:hypothetical protein
MVGQAIRLAIRLPSPACGRNFSHLLSKRFLDMSANF